jgi:hypothetical protein
MRSFLALAACCAAGCGSPQVLQPPAPWHLTLSLPYFSVNSFCRNDVAGTRAEACVMPTVLGPKLMVLPVAGRDGVTPDLVRQLQSHEEGHLRGWPADHPR